MFRLPPTTAGDGCGKSAARIDSGSSASGASCVSTAVNRTGRFRSVVKLFSLFHSSRRKVALAFRFAQR
ncbi:hypothetical protein KCP70_15045 [Salmonella enterica subsp. enterica]|nr:hypothetical protein KCP70_15045 [Salmonella enterica subsp. enterica]